jgi:hypothetical protein
MIDEKTDNAELAALRTYSSPALEKALVSSKTFWEFITDPSTPYMDRMAASHRGGSVLSPEELHWLWEAMAEIATVPSGVDPAPCTAVAVFLPPAREQDLSRAMQGLAKGSTPPEPEPTRVVLGHEIKLSKKNVSYPITAEEREHAPWLWQMQTALSLLFDRTVVYYGGSRYEARVKAAWDWPIKISTNEPGRPYPSDSDPTEWQKIYIRSRALTEWAPHDTLLLQTILKLALNNDNYFVAYGGHVQDLSAWGQDSYHYEELAHTAQIAVIQKTRWENVAAEAAFVMISMAARKSDPVNMPNVKPLRTATGILAIGRWAEDQRLSPWNRYYGFVLPICRIVDDAPCPAKELRDPKDPELDIRLKAFDEWFGERKAALEEQSEAERPHLKSLAKELQTEID